ncbi:MAG TPA: hypothetical protein VGE40_01265 [Bacilli bacterium]
MNKSLQEWMMLAVGVIVIVALVWGSMVDRAENIQEKIDNEISQSN